MILSGEYEAQKQLHIVAGVLHVNEATTLRSYDVKRTIGANCDRSRLVGSNVCAHHERRVPMWRNLWRSYEALQVRCGDSA